MNYKNGDVIVISCYNGANKKIAIFDKYENVSGKINYNGLHIYTELDISTNELYFKSIDNTFSYDINSIEHHLATELEKNLLYNALGRYFTEDYDYDWYNHFTDSSYFDILDCLLEAFAIKLDDNNDYPDFVQDIRNYIWDICCDVLGVSDTIEKEIKETSNMVSIDKVCEWLKQNMYQTPIFEYDEDETPTYYVCANICNTVEEFIDKFKKDMKE